MPTRQFGRHPDQISIIGLGGGHLSRKTVTDEMAQSIVRAALAGGVTFFDTSWDYGDGLSELRFGRILANHRDSIFLMSKVCDRTRDGALKQLDESLRRLQTDHLDLWQFHEINYDNDPEWIFASGGAIEAAELAKAQGKVRYVGFTGHKSPHIFAGMLDSDYPWDACQMPVSVFDAQFRSFTNTVLPELNKRGIACIGMKSLGGNGQFITEEGLTAQEARRYALSQSITTLSCGTLTMANIEQDLDIARSFSPMTSEEQHALRSRVRSEATDGRHEWFKTSTYFDHPYHARAHGFGKHLTIPR
jgi:predicted aldo/keto reductase-like oxidoreductase